MSLPATLISQLKALKLGPLRDALEGRMAQA